MPETRTFYHCTSRSAAEAILTNGFRDGEGRYGMDGLAEPLRGVFLSDRPLDGNEGTYDGPDAVLLEVILDVNEEEIADDEVVEEGKPYREWILPAAFINEKAKVRIVEDEG